MHTLQQNKGLEMCTFYGAKLILEAASEVLPSMETWAPCPSVVPEAQPRALRKGNTRRFLCEVEPRTQLLIGLEFFQNKFFTESSRTYRRSMLVFRFWWWWEKKTNCLFNHLNSSGALWLSWKLCDFGSRGTRFEFHRGQLFTSVSLFFLKVRTAKNFKVFHINGDGLRTCAPVKSIKTSQQYPRMRVLLSC